MSPTDDELERLILTCKLLANALQCNGEVLRGAHVFNAMVDLQRARSPEVVAGLEAKRWEAARAG